MLLDPRTSAAFRRKRAAKVGTAPYPVRIECTVCCPKTPTGADVSGGPPLGSSAMGESHRSFPQTLSGSSWPRGLPRKCRLNRIRSDLVRSRRGEGFRRIRPFRPGYVAVRRALVLPRNGSRGVLSRGEQGEGEQRGRSSVARSDGTSARQEHTMADETNPNAGPSLDPEEYVVRRGEGECETCGWENRCVSIAGRI